MCTKPFDRKFTKTTGVFVCLLYIITGIVMMSFGISIKATPNNFLSMYGYHGLDVHVVGGLKLQSIAIFMIIVSVLSIVVGLMGIYSFICEIEMDLKIFTALQAALIIINIALIIFTAVYLSRDFIRQEMKKTIIKDFSSQDITINNSSEVISIPTDVVDRAWANTQLETMCCGIDGPEDYWAIPWEGRVEDVPSYGNITLATPLSCCRLNPDIEPMTLVSLTDCIGNSSAFINKKGCLSSVMVYYAYSAVSVYRISPILILFEIGLIFLALKFLYDLKSYEVMQ